MTRGTTSICRQRRPQQGPKAPCAVTGAPVAAYCTVQRTAPEGIPSPRLCCLTPAGSSLRQRDGTYLVPSSRYYYSLATLSLLSAKVNKKHKNLRNLFLGLKTVDRHVGNGRAQIVGDRNRIEAGRAAGADAGCLGQHLAALGGGQEGDIVLQRHGDVFRKSVDRHGKGEVCQREERAALRRTGGVEVMGLQLHGANGMAGFGQPDLTAGGFGGEAVAGKGCADLLEGWHVGFLLSGVGRIFFCVAV